jgi:hypothetical protein
MFNLKRLRPTAAIALCATACASIAPAVEAHTGSDEHDGGTAQLSPETRELLRKARRATRVFRDVDAAKAAGYERASACEEDPKYGAMGIHYANPALVADGGLAVERPEVLVYQPTRDGRLRLGAIEYFRPDADQDLGTDPDRPFLFGVPFDGPMLGHNPRMPVHYDLHVWLYRHNPAGLFAMWNPRVQCPDDPTGTS